MLEKAVDTGTRLEPEAEEAVGVYVGPVELLELVLVAADWVGDDISCVLTDVAAELVPDDPPGVVIGVDVVDVVTEGVGVIVCCAVWVVGEPVNLVFCDVWSIVFGAVDCVESGEADWVYGIVV